MRNDETERGHLGLHDWLRITAAPAQTPSVIGKRLIDAGALQPGTYECEFRCDGLKNLEAHLKATFASGSSTSSGGTMYADRTTTLTAWTGVGAMVTATEQTLTIATLKGEKYAKVILAIVGAQTVTFTLAEVLGLKA